MSDKREGWPRIIMAWTGLVADDYAHGGWDELYGSENPERPSAEYILRSEYLVMQDRLTEAEKALRYYADTQALARDYTIFETDAAGLTEKARAYFEEKKHV